MHMTFFVAFSFNSGTKMMRIFICVTKDKNRQKNRILLGLDHERGPQISFMLYGLYMALVVCVLQCLVYCPC